MRIRLKGLELKTGCDLADVLRQESHSLIAVRLELDAVDTREGGGAGFCATAPCDEARDGIKANSGAGFTLKGERDFNAIWKTRECHVQVRMSFREVFERLMAGSKDSRLQLSDGVAIETGG